ncbi:MAG TPA: vitamin K epoxide reductase family protein [Myxococcales bacterium]|jgi:protein-disulfide isomerase
MDTRPQSEPPRWLPIASVVLCLVGLAVAADLTSIHFNVHTNPRYQSFCAISKEVNCDTVALSDWSVFLGLPVSIWGLFGYLAMGAVAAWGLFRRSLGRGLMLLLASFSVVVSVALLVVSKLVIQSMCLMCIGSWMVNLTLFGFALLAVRKVGAVAALKEDARALASQPGLTITLVVLALTALGGTWTLYPRYWEQSGPIGPGTLETGVDESGSPWIGARSPQLVIEEYSDYQCPFCSGAHRKLRELVGARADRVRLVHKNYPLDQACNPVIKGSFHDFACQRAKAAVCAGEQGKFWEMNDLLFLGQRKPGLDVEALAAKLGLDAGKFAACLESQTVAEHLQADLSQAGKHAIKGTPSYVVGGELQIGQLSAQELDRRLNAAK